jgi:hypothetical protein
VTRRSRCIRPSPPATRASARWWHLRSPSAPLVSGRPFARPQPEQGCQGFSPSQPRHRPFVRHAINPKVMERSRAPCAHRLGEPTKRQCRGRALSLDLCEAAVSKLTLLLAEPGSRVPASGFSAHRYRDPTRLPRTRSAAGGPAAEARFDGQRIRRTLNRGLAPALRPLRTVAPLREENDERPRPGPAPSCRLAMCSSWGLAAFPWTHRRGASNPFLQPTFAHEHPP